MYRVNNRTKSDMALFSLAVSAHKGKKQAKAFRTALEKL